MISLPFRRRPDPTIGALYGMIVAQARSAGFYRDYGVPDTVTGRFEMIVIHLVLVLRRMRGPGGTATPAGQALFDLFCRDMDDNFREMGIGDLKVPKEMRRIGEAFYGRAAVYDRALDAADGDALRAAVARNVFADAADLGSGRLAAYMSEAETRLSRLSPDRIGAEPLPFPDPDDAADKSMPNMETSR